VPHALRSSNVNKIVDAEELPIRLCNYVDVYYNDRITDKLAFSAGSATPREIEKFKLRPCDVVITKDSETPGDIAIPALVDASAAGVVCGYHLAIMRARAAVMRGDFLFWCLKSRPVMEAFSTRAQGITRFGLTLDGIGTVPVPTPDLKTQRALAGFLDRETARIDQLIEKKRRQVGLLEEYGACQIHQVITKGLNSNARLTDSGVEWFGKIPAHWIVKPLRHVALFQRGHDLPDDARIAGGVPLVSSGGISSGHNIAIAKAPGIVTGRYGTIGKFYFIERDYWPLNTTLFTRRIFERPRYVWYLLQDMAHIFVLNSSKAAVPGVDRNDIHSERVPVPPSDEQIEIARWLDDRCVERARFISAVKLSIDRVRELRSALITAAVTGQIDVATWGKRGTTDGRLDAIEADMAAAAQPRSRPRRAPACSGPR
jgi:type I restriction enzyme S subunit